VIYIVCIAFVKYQIPKYTVNRFIYCSLL